MSLDQSPGSTRHDHLVVIGSSAGGIEALSKLLGSLKPDFPSPLVLAQHLDPARPSHLGGILERKTVLPVIVVEGRTPLEPGRVYVVPSNRHVVIEDGHVDLESDHGARPRPSVDLLLSTAAASYGERLVAVILTGSGSDGAAGAIDVKHAGGVVVIQNPQTARYPSMPLALPPTAVDHVLDLDQIGPMLEELVSGLVPRLEEKSDDTLRDILALISRTANIDFRPYKASSILRRIGRRMTVTHTRGIRDYAQYLESHPEEVAELVMALLIKVTEFFRDPEAFELLKTHVLPELIARRRDHGRVLRLWSAGCATGEEAYSLALLTSDLLGQELPEWSVKIFATDVDERAIEFARRGLYPVNVLRQMSDSYKSDFFEQADHGFRVAKNLRQMVIFGQQDLSRGVPFPRIDLVVCRNLLIYFQPELQQEVLDLFAFSLQQSHGYLLLGKAETARPSKSVFELVHKKWKLYRCVSGPLEAVASVAPVRAMPSARRTPPGDGAPATEGALPEAEIAQLRRFNEVLLRHLPTGVVVIDRAYRILSSNGAARRLLGIRDLANDQDFLHTARGLPYGEVRAAIDTAFRDRNAVALPELFLQSSAGGEGRYVSLSIMLVQVEPGMPESGLISVVDATDAVQTRRRLEAMQSEQQQLVEELGTPNKRLGELNKELQDSNEELQAANEELMLAQEELQATNEEFEATNEELQATNEELETNNEELQATNEELETTNEELQARSSELQELTRILGAEKRRLGEVVALAPLAIVVLQGPGLLIEALSPRFEPLLTEPHVRGRPFDDVLIGGASALVDRVRQVLRTGEAVVLAALDVAMARGERDEPDKKYVFTLVPSRGPGGDVVGVVVYAEDATERIARHDAEQLQRLRLTVEHAGQVALALFDARDGQLLYSSPRYREVAQAAPLPTRELLSESATRREPRRLPEVRIRPEHGAESVWDFSLIPIAEETHDVRYVVLSAAEVTDPVTAREELSRVDRLKSEFLAVASHELRTPLQPLKVHAELLAQIASERSDPALADLVSKVQKQVSYLVRISDDLLDATRLQNRKLALELTPIDLRGVAREAVERAGLLENGQKVMLDESVDQPVLVRGDQVRLLQVAVNLLENALRHANGNDVTISVGAEDGTALLRVADHGGGIAAADLGRVFESFEQAGSGRGLGLGLSIAKGLVEQHGGSIGVESAEGRGTMFSVRLPLLSTAG